MWQPEIQTNGGLGCWRLEIDAVSEDILDLIRKRVEIVSEIKAWKRANGKPVVDAVREQQLLSHLLTKAVEKGLDPLMAIEVFIPIIRNARESQN